MLYIALSGANGRMGKAIVSVAKNHPEINIIAKLVNSEKNLENLKYLKKAKQLDIFIDFSNPAGCEDYLKICQKLKIPMVIGTTGFSTQQHKKITLAAKNIPILYAPNMSVSANICFALLANLSKLWSSNFYNQDIPVEIIDIHHKYKKDAPSGTALKMAEIIKQNKNNLAKNLNINFISKRIGNVKGKHQIKFSNLYEELTIKHIVKNRSSFASGALLAAKLLINKPNNLYSLSDLIFIAQELQA